MIPTVRILAYVEQSNHENTKATKEHEEERIFRAFVVPAVSSPGDVRRRLEAIS